MFNISLRSQTAAVKATSEGSKSTKRVQEPNHEPIKKIAEGKLVGKQRKGSEISDEESFLYRRKIKLFTAVEDNSLDDIQALIAGHADLNVQDGEGNTPLHYAAQRNNHALIQKLLESGSDQLIENDAQQNAFHLAKTVETLGVFFRFSDISKTMIYQSERAHSKSNHTLYFKTLIKYGSNEDIKSICQKNDKLRSSKVWNIELLKEAISSDQQEAFITVLPFLKNSESEVFLILNYSIQKFKLWPLKVIVEQLSKVVHESTQDLNSNTLLHYAVSAGFEEGVDYLLSLFNKFSSKNKELHTPLSIALANGDEKIIQIFLRKLRQKQTTLLHHAVHTDDIKSMKLLIERRVDVTQKDGKGLLAIESLSSKNKSHVKEAFKLMDEAYICESLIKGDAEFFESMLFLNFPTDLMMQKKFVENKIKSYPASKSVLEMFLQYNLTRWVIDVIVKTPLINSLGFKFVLDNSSPEVFVRQISLLSQQVLCQYLFKDVMVLNQNETRVVDHVLIDNPFVVITTNDYCETDYLLYTKYNEFSLGPAELLAIWSRAKGSFYEMEKILDKTFIPSKVESGLCVISLDKSHLKLKPLNVLSKTVAGLESKCRDAFYVDFTNDRGVDAGGVGRQFVNTLFKNVVKSLKCVKLNNGHYRPALSLDEEGNSVPLTSAEQLHFRELGMLIMFCLNFSDHMPTGQYLDKSFFYALKSYEPCLLRREFAGLDFNCPKIFNALFSTYEALMMVNEDDRKSLIILKNALAVSSESSMDQVMEAYYIAQTDDAFLNLDVQVSSILSFIPQIKIAIQNIAIEKIKIYLSGLHEILKGMKGSKHNYKATLRLIQKFQPNNLFYKLQGRTSRVQILEFLEFKDHILSVNKRWITNWIKNSSRKKIEQFLFTATGSEAMGKETIFIYNLVSEGSEPVPPISFQTCSRSIYIHFESLHTERELFELMNNAVELASNWQGFDSR